MNEHIRNALDPDDKDKLLADTLKMVLYSIAKELNVEIDSRAQGYGKSAFRRCVIYLVALIRDLVRIPLHHYKGIGQAQFRYRVFYISNTAIPTIHFFLERYSLDKDQRRSLEEAIDLLRQGAALINDGIIPALDAWYATMQEFYELTQYSREAALKITRAGEDVNLPFSADLNT